MIGEAQRRDIVNVRRISYGDAEYPTVMRDRLGDAAPMYLHAFGDPGIIRNRLIGLICSVRCPGSIVIKTLDVARALRDAGVAVIGGFHSPMEREFLDILLRGSQPVVLCAAKSLQGLRIGAEARRAVSGGRLLVLSPFDDRVRRTTAAQAAQRNDLVAALSDVLLVPHAAPGGKTRATIHKVLARGQRLITIDDQENSESISLGAAAVSEADKDRIITKMCP